MLTDYYHYCVWGEGGQESKNLNNTTTFRSVNTVFILHLRVLIYVTCVFVSVVLRQGKEFNLYKELLSRESMLRIQEQIEQS